MPLPPAFKCRKPSVDELLLMGCQPYTDLRWRPDSQNKTVAKSCQSAIGIISGEKLERRLVGKSVRYPLPHSYV